MPPGPPAFPLPVAPPDWTGNGSATAMARTCLRAGIESKGAGAGVRDGKASDANAEAKPRGRIIAVRETRQENTRSANRTRPTSRMASEDPWIMRCSYALFRRMSITGSARVTTSAWPTSTPTLNPSSDSAR
jgi:hypothetical protein